MCVLFFAVSGCTGTGKRAVRWDCPYSLEIISSWVRFIFMYLLKTKTSEMKEVTYNIADLLPS